METVSFPFVEVIKWGLNLSDILCKLNRGEDTTSVIPLFRASLNGPFIPVLRFTFPLHFLAWQFSVRKTMSSKWKGKLVLCLRVPHQTGIILMQKYKLGIVDDCSRIFCQDSLCLQVAGYCFLPVNLPLSCCRILEGGHLQPVF